MWGLFELGSCLWKVVPMAVGKDVQEFLHGKVLALDFPKEIQMMYHFYFHSEI
jgi:hypothetical protein